MKRIIDNDTGEVLEVEEKNELMIRELYKLGTDLEQYDELEEQAMYIQEKLEIWKYQNRENIKNVLKKYNQKNIETSTRTYTYLPERTQKRVDNERLKELGVYDKCLKLVPVKEGLMIRRKKER